MSHEELIYHREREQHCRTLAELADDPDVRRRHEELAALHAGRAAQFGCLEESGTQFGAA